MAIFSVFITPKFYYNENAIQRNINSEERNCEMVSWLAMDVTVAFNFRIKHQQILCTASTWRTPILHLTAHHLSAQHVLCAQCTLNSFIHLAINQWLVRSLLLLFGVCGNRMNHNKTSIKFVNKKIGVKRRAVVCFGNNELSMKIGV